MCQRAAGDAQHAAPVTNAVFPAREARGLGGPCGDGGGPSERSGSGEVQVVAWGRWFAGCGLLGAGRFMRWGGRRIGCGDGAFVSVAQLGHLGLGIVEPVGGPEPVEAPAETLQVLAAQPVAVADAAGFPV